MTALLKVYGNGRSKLFMQVLAALICPETRTNPEQWDETEEGQDDREAQGILEGHEVKQVAIEVANAELAVDLTTIIERSRMLQIIVSYLRNDSGTVLGTMEIFDLLLQLWIFAVMSPSMRPRYNCSRPWPPNQSVGFCAHCNRKPVGTGVRTC